MMYVLFFILPFIVSLIAPFVESNMGGYTPMSPDEEYHWLRGLGLSHEEAEELVDL